MHARHSLHPRSCAYLGAERLPGQGAIPWGAAEARVEGTGRSGRVGSSARRNQNPAGPAARTCGVPLPASNGGPTIEPLQMFKADIDPSGMAPRPTRWLSPR